VSEGGLTVAGLLDEVTAALGNPTEARELVAALFDAPRTWALLHAADRVGLPDRDRARLAAQRRRAGAPLAYAVGRAAFRHLMLDVDERVLIPRPETEVLVDLVLEEIGRSGPRGGVVVDIGTGSGAIALALATEGGALFSSVIGTDVSTDALAVAAANGRRLGVSVDWRHGADLAPVGGGLPRRRETALQTEQRQRQRVAVPLAAVVSNPPYISADDAWALPAAVRAWEPPVALLSGQDGLDATRAIVRGAGGVLVPGGLLAMEVDSRRAGCVAEIVTADGRYDEPQIRLDLTERARFVIARRHAKGYTE
jgi:release factor glutamine methyltransferase